VSEPPEPELRPEEPRRRPSTLGGAVYLLISLTTAAGLVFAVVAGWRAGVITMGVAMLVGAIARLLLPSSRSGMLGVRSKSFDVAFMTIIAAAILLIGITLYNPAFPFQPG
jgi:hypothetical protein